MRRGEGEEGTEKLEKVSHENEAVDLSEGREEREICRLRRHSVLSRGVTSSGSQPTSSIDISPPVQIVLIRAVSSD